MALTALILGAGLGREYGFPDGRELRAELIHSLPGHEYELKKIMEWYHSETIDDIAAKFPKHAKAIRDQVAKILIRRENEALLSQNEKPNTYKLILRQIGLAQQDGHDVKIVTFNYDRSLVHLLHQINSIEIPERRVNAAVINHVYGRLALLESELSVDAIKRDYNTYGAHSGPRIRSVGAPTSTEYSKVKDEYNFLRESEIAFIGEDRPRATQIIKGILDNSDQIFFLGVGYHEPNMEILGFDFRSKYSNKLIVGTGFGLQKEQIEGIKSDYPAIDQIESCDAHTFLKFLYPVHTPGKNIGKKSGSILTML